MSSANPGLSITNRQTLNIPAMAARAGQLFIPEPQPREAPTSDKGRLTLRANHINKAGNGIPVQITKTRSENYLNWNLVMRIETPG